MGVIRPDVGIEDEDIEAEEGVVRPLVYIPGSS